MNEESRITALNEQFYAAFEALDFEAMAACWSQRTTDVCVHPGWAPLHGWTEIKNAWRAIFANTGFMQVRPVDVRVRIDHDIAVLTCVEELYSVADQVTVQGAVACTHVFEMLDGKWRLTLHHGSPIAAAQRVAPSSEDQVN